MFRMFRLEFGLSPLKWWYIYQLMLKMPLGYITHFFNLDALI